MTSSVDNTTQPACHTSWLVSTKSSPLNSISILLAVTCLLETTSTVLNTGVFLGLLRLRRSNSNRYVGILLNLVVTDLLYNLTAEFLYIIHLALQTFNVLSCQLVAAIGWLGLFLCLISFLMLVLATVERYIAIFYPFRYLGFIHSKICLAAIVLVYLISAVSTLMFRLSSFSYAAGISVLTLLSFGGLVLISVYARVFWLRHKIGKEIQKQRAPEVAPKITTYPPEEGSEQGYPQTRRLTTHQSLAPTKQNGNSRKGRFRNWSRDKRVAFLVALLLICMIVCYLPYLIAVSLHVFAKSKVTVSRELLHWLWSIMLINATLNPIIFFYFDKEIRYHIVKVFSCFQVVSDAEASTAYFHRSSTVRPLETE